MQYPHFTNGTGFLEYALLFLHHKLLVEKVTVKSMAEYSKFELTEGSVESYNHWIDAGKPDKEIIENWLRSHYEDATHFKNQWNIVYHPKPVLWNDREKTDYFKAQLAESFLFENYIAQLLKEKYGMEIGAFMDAHGQYDLGENALGIEIKNDKLIHKTGNLYIEYQEKSSADKKNFVNSGILKDDNTRFFLIGTQDQFYILRKPDLLAIFNTMKTGKPQEGLRSVQIDTSRGMLLSLKKFHSMCITLDEMVEILKKRHD